jgi:hypothetical protein
MRRSHKTVITISIAVLILLISFFLPSIKSFLNQVTNSELIERVDKHALSANIKIVQLKYKSDGNSSSTSVSAGANGVIFHREDSKYYVLTAQHVIAELDNVDKTQIIVMGYDDLDYKDSQGIRRISIYLHTSCVSKAGKKRRYYK